METPMENPMENPTKPPFSYGFPMVFPWNIDGISESTGVIWFGFLESTVAQVAAAFPLDYWELNHL